MSGTITVPPSVYQGAETGSLNLRVRSSPVPPLTYGAAVLSPPTTASTMGQQHRLTAVEHKTYFDTADKITLAMGNTMRLPVSIATSTGETRPSR